MKNRKITSASLFASPTLIGSLSVISCSQINNNPIIDEDNENQSYNLLFSDYFVKYNDSIYQNRNEIKQKIIKTINQYRLKEWNDYYQKENLSKILDINLKDYDQLAQGKDYIKNWNEIDGSKGNIATSIYNQQDEQFQYINDFINLINNENNKNQEDFLYLRWLYFSIYGANLYQLKVGLPFSNNLQNSLDKQINKINVIDWVKAISKCVIEGNFDDLLGIVYTFFVYYGLSVDLNKIEDYFNSLKEEFKKPSEIIKELTKVLKEYEEKLKNELGKEFVDEFSKLYKELKKIHHDLTLKEFIKEFKNLVNESKDVYEKFKNTIDKWLNFSLREELENLIIRLIDVIPKFELPDFINEWKINGLQYCVLHARLCAQDMLMRLLSKNYSNDSNYLLWKAKKDRAINIYQKMVKYSRLLPDSLNPGESINEIIKESLTEVIDNFLPPNNKVTEFINKSLKNMISGILKNLVSNLLNSLSQPLINLVEHLTKELGLVYININDYYENSKRRY